MMMILNCCIKNYKSNSNRLRKLNNNEIWVIQNLKKLLCFAVIYLIMYYLILV